MSQDFWVPALRIGLGHTGGAELICRDMLVVWVALYHSWGCTIATTVRRPNSWTKSKQSLNIFPPCYSQPPLHTALPWDFYFFKLTQPLTVSVKEKGGTPDIKPPYPLPYGLRNLHRNLKSENSQDYAQKPERNCTFMNSATVHVSMEQGPFEKGGNIECYGLEGYNCVVFLGTLWA